MTAAIVIVAAVALAVAMDLFYRRFMTPRRRALRLLERHLSLGWHARNPRIDLFPLSRRESYFFAFHARGRGVVALRFGPWPDAEPGADWWMVRLYDPTRADTRLLANEDASMERFRATEVWAPNAGGDR